MEERKVTTHKNIYTALASAQADMGPVFKGAVNPHFKSRYADLADVMQVAIPALAKHGIAIWHSMRSEEGGSRIMRTILSHGESDTHIDCDVPLLVQKNDMQGMKSATTYAKRIGVESLTGIAPEDDDGNAAAKAAPKQEAAPRPEAVDVAKSSLGHADSLDALKAIFTDLPYAIRRLPAVIEAKDARKAALEQPAPQPDPITADEIPY